ncbi:lisH domain-containing protein FOPNL-like, partial [Thraustotheca clavata]
EIQWAVALKETLEARGTMGPIKARLRAEIFQALDEGGAKPKLSNENLIINELIREYFEYNGYRHALSVFLPESGQPQDPPFQRRFLAHELNINEDPRYNQIPLLYSIITALQQARVDRGHNASDFKSTNPEPAMQQVIPPRSQILESTRPTTPDMPSITTEVPVQTTTPGAVVFMN